MSFDYVSDLFGECSGYNTRYTHLENFAIDTIRKYFNKEIDSKTFAETMQEVRKRLLELDRKDEDGNTVIDQDVPLWLVNFLVFKFLRWFDYYAIQESAKIKPELTHDKRWPSIMDSARNYERELHQAMEYCINEWDKIHNPGTTYDEGEVNCEIPDEVPSDIPDCV